MNNSTRDDAEALIKKSKEIRELYKNGQASMSNLQSFYTKLNNSPSEVQTEYALIKHAKLNEQLNTMFLLMKNLTQEKKEQAIKAMPQKVGENLDVRPHIMDLDAVINILNNNPSTSNADNRITRISERLKKLPSVDSENARKITEITFDVALNVPSANNTKTVKKVSKPANQPRANSTMPPHMDKVTRGLTMSFNALSLKVNLGKKPLSDMDHFFNTTLSGYPQETQKHFAENIEFGFKTTAEIVLSEDEEKRYAEMMAKFAPGVTAHSFEKSAKYVKKTLGDNASKQVDFILSEFTKMDDSDYKNPKTVRRIQKSSKSSL